MKRVKYAALLLIAIIFMASCSSTEKNDAVVVVNGYAEVQVPADAVELRVSSEAIADTTDEARSKTSEMISRATEILMDEFAVSKEDITTGYVTLEPYYEWLENGRTLKGQRASQSITVLMRDPSALGEFFDRVGTIDGITVSRVSLKRLNDREAKAEARRMAVENALEKAGSYAESLGLTLGKTLQISDSAIVAPVSLYSGVVYESVAAADTGGSSYGTSYYAGLIAISDSVTLISSME